MKRSDASDGFWWFLGIGVLVFLYFAGVALVIWAGHLR